MAGLAPESSHLAAIDHLIVECGSLVSGETAVVLCDERTRDLGTAFLERLTARGGRARLLEVPYSPTHGTEPPATAADAMSAAKLIFGLTSTSKAHTEARRRACDAGARYLSLPEYTWNLLLDPSIRAGYRERSSLVNRIAGLFTAGTRAHITSSAGTDITLDITGRIGNACPGFVDRPGMLGSPPDIEANVSPIEDGSNGIVVVDGSIPCPQIGRLAAPVTLTIKNGRIVGFSGSDAMTIDTVKRLFGAVGSDKAYVLAECGVGLNDKAQITGSMLTDEGANGCMHFGFGSNATVGGKNDVPFHLDFVFRAPTLTIDGTEVLKNGEPI